uniref:Retrotransposon gag domain-containing protein n=1 Tax=Cajanus cajan TaxID=3821 RepID=A0A151QL54_CAJCA|nr:hypothetical protein KK1_049270 [Cajanus cajan]
MAEHHTRKTTIDRLEEAITQLTLSQTTLSTDHHALSTKVDTILDRLATLTTQPPSTPPPFPHRPPIKLDVPRFDGHDSLGWIFKINQFFDYQGTPDAERITVASFYMDGPALSWYQWMFRNGYITSWPGLLQALESRFAPSYYDDASGLLFKLCATWHFQALQPTSLPHAMALAKLQEDKIVDRRRQSHNPTSSSSSVTPASSTLALPSSPKVHFKHLSSAEIASRREKGLCYHCDEKFTPSHRCKGRLLLLIAGDDDVGNIAVSEMPLSTTLEDTSADPHSSTPLSYFPT